MTLMKCQLVVLWFWIFGFQNSKKQVSGLSLLSRLLRFSKLPAPFTCELYLTERRTHWCVEEHAWRDNRHMQNQDHVCAGELVR